MITCGSAAQFSAPMAKIAETRNNSSTAATLSIWARSSATYTTGARVKINPMMISMPMAMKRGVPPNMYEARVALLVAQPGHRLAK